MKRTQPEPTTVGGFVRLIKDLQTIRVLAISPKVVDQLPWRHDGQDDPFDWTGKEMLGRIVPSGLLVRDPQNNQLFKVGDVCYIEARANYLTPERGGPAHAKAIAQAQSEVQNLPQIFQL